MITLLILRDKFSSGCVGFKNGNVRPRLIYEHVFYFHFLKYVLILTVNKKIYNFLSKKEEDIQL